MEKITTDNETTLALHLWQPDKPARGVLHWLHGMAEHGARYAALAQQVNEHGWVFAVHDHRGHGHSIGPGQIPGFFASTDGWQRVCEDALQVGQALRHRFPGVPYVLGGHSMGSLIALSTAQRDGSALDGLILCGTDSKPPLLWHAAGLLARAEKARLGATATSQLLKAVSFDAFARKIPDRRTDFDWLSHLPEVVDAYQADPLCGFECTTQLWVDLCDGMARANSRQGLDQLPTRLPILLIAGAEDPMSNHGKGVTRLGKQLARQHNLQDTVLFNPGRHEILNDLCAADARKKVTDFLGQLS